MFKNIFSKMAKPDYERFAEAAGKQFAYSLQKYNPRVDGIGRGYYFNNFIVVINLDSCMMRFILDRNDVFIELAPLKSPPITREANTINLWSDVSILTSWLEDQGKEFKWFYHYGSDKKIESQLAELDSNLKNYWDDIIGLYSEDGFFTKHQNKFIEFRKLVAQKSWQALGWNPSKNIPKPNKTVLGHFPQYSEVATDLRAATDLSKTISFLGMEDNAWKTLWITGSETMFWEIDKKFVDNAVDERQDEIVLTTEARNPESFFAREIKYLVTKLKMLTLTT